MATIKNEPYMDPTQTQNRPIKTAIPPGTWLELGSVRGAETPLPVVMEEAEDTPLNWQVGGGHYKDMKIQPVEFIHANNLGFLEGCIIKRICRWRAKDGVKDLEKIKHEVDLLIELERKK